MFESKKVRSILDSFLLGRRAKVGCTYITEPMLDDKKRVGNVFPNTKPYLVRSCMDIYKDTRMIIILTCTWSGIRVICINLCK